MNKIMATIDRTTALIERKIMEILCKKEKGNEQLIVALVMIAISVALVLIFKEKISALLTGFMTNVTSKINTALGV